MEHITILTKCCRCGKDANASFSISTENLDTLLGKIGSMKQPGFICPECVEVLLPMMRKKGGG